MQKLRKFERALANGQWFDHVKATKVFADIAVALGISTAAAAVGGAVVAGGLISAGASIYGTMSQAGIAGQQLSLEGNQASKQNQAFGSLQQLITDPGSFFNSPVYQASAAQGSQAVARQNASAFGPNSGNEATALQTFGQGFGQQQLLQQEQLLAGMSGTGFNPTAAAGTASGAAQAGAGNLASLGGLLSFFGNSGGGGGGYSGDPAAGGGTAVAGMSQGGYILQ